MKLMKILFAVVIIILVAIILEKQIPEEYIPEPIKNSLTKIQDSIENIDVGSLVDKIPEDILPKEERELISSLLPEQREGVTREDIQDISIRERQELRDMISSYSQSSQGNTTIGSFDTAKRRLANIYVETLPAITFYCSCDFTGSDIDHSNCGFENDGRWDVRATRLEWEHVVPAENFWRAFEEWRNPENFPHCQWRTGRQCAGTNEIYRAMEADLYNLLPAIGSVNAARSNFNFGMVNKKDWVYGECDFHIEDRIAEPKDSIKGDIARIYFYMAAVYPEVNLLSSQSERLFLAWDRMDPIDELECRRYFAYKEVQKNINPILHDTCAELLK